MKRDYVTAERKAYFYMIDSAIDIGWRWYCDLEERPQLIPGWTISYSYKFLTFREDQTLEVARGYAQKFNIMPDTVVYYEYFQALEDYSTSIGWGPEEIMEALKVGGPGASFQGDKQ